jgi:toxin-antitoxin system PIN domain toxin
VIVDANILLYATDDTSEFHAPAMTWLEDALNGASRIGLPWPTLTAFLRISTHPRAARNPLSARQAWDVMTAWLEAGPAWIPRPGPRHADVFRKLTIDGGLQGNLVSDAHLAALAIEHGVGVCSADSDFARFPGLDWINPLR